MGKLIISTDADLFKTMQDHIIDFKGHDVINGDFGFLQTFQKLRQKTCNVYSYGDDFAAGVGTFLYHGKKDREALELILQDADECGTVQKEILGSYCVVIHKNRITTLFVDSAGTYNLYYFFDALQNKLIATTTYYHVAKCLKAPIIKQNDLLAEWNGNNILDKTAFQDIRKMTGLEMLVHDSTGWRKESLVRKEPLPQDGFWERVTQMYDGISRLFPKSCVFMTGGQDSRLTLALMLKLGFQPVLCYGTGNSSTTFTKVEDRQTVMKIAERFNMEVHDMDWSDSDHEEMDRYLQKYGEGICLYGFNKHVMREFEERLDVDFVGLGYFGEVFRSIESISAFQKDVFSLEECVDSLFIRSKARAIVPEFGAYREYVLREYEDVCKIKGIDPQKLCKQEFQKLDTPRRQRVDVTINNFANQFFYTFPLLGDVSITDSVESVDYETRCNSKYLMHSIGELCPPLLEIPFFSHIKMQVLNPKTYELQATGVFRIKDQIRAHIHNPALMQLARKAFYALKRDKKGLQEISASFEAKQHLLPILKQKPILDGIDLEVLVETYDYREICELLLLLDVIEDIVS